MDIYFDVSDNFVGICMLKPMKLYIKHIQFFNIKYISIEIFKWIKEP